MTSRSSEFSNPDSFVPEILVFIERMWSKLLRRHQDYIYETMTIVWFGCILLRGDCHSKSLNS
jgi:hypothetical protein